MLQILYKTLMLHPGLKSEVILSNGQQGAIPLFSNIDWEHGHDQRDMGQLRLPNDLKVWMSTPSHLKVWMSTPSSSSFLCPDAC